ncbi:hypothetical protein A2397_00445 [Candidatus Amesbacteria bacterium RIFOXYB1_FULL_44_23]|uniref:Uncharacterized protein n=1 Tax=Candidatus Amesbacteria bacterium RIFOXYB1_FULL_44_23 TaxID=1797263 RepID=A0A1F4ZU62_9BACT|nr:MAG: hypothetical protein A2397_00445 [Candidatus Amesbacteria bacterium RIFOXYB1_FULL_44_23]
MTFEVLGILVLAIVLGVVLFAYDRSLRELAGIKKDKIDFEQRARRRMLKILREARDKAVEIVGEAQVDAGNLKQMMDVEMDRLAKEQLSDYKETIQNISKNIEDEVKNEVGELKKVLEMETVEAEKTVAKRMAEDYAQAEKKIEDYKLAKYKQIEEGAVGVLEEVGRKLVGKTLNFREHTDFIISALEKAKLQNDI